MEIKDFYLWLSLVPGVGNKTIENIRNLGIDIKDLFYMKDDEILNIKNINTNIKQNIVKYIIIPFDEEVYAKYLGSLVDCEISLKGYPKQIRQTLDELANMVYSQYSTKKSYTPPSARGNKGDNNPRFSESMNSTLNQMRKY